MKYHATHPWLTFSLNLQSAPARLWMMLGECGSKCEHLSKVPLRPKTARRLHRIYLAKGIRATTAIEGNTLTQAQVEAALRGKLDVVPSKIYMKREIENMLALMQETSQAIYEERDRALTVQTIKDYNRGVLNGLNVEDHVRPGEVPTVDIGVAGYRGAPRAECEHLLGKLTHWLSTPWDNPDNPDRLLNAVSESILKAILAHLYLAWIHPFGDGNGRTARMLEVRILMQSGVPSPATQLLSNHYNLTRSRYYHELDRASKSGGDVIPFLLYAIEGFRDGLREQIDIVHRQQMDVTWENYVYERFREDDTKTGKRRRRLVLDLTRHGNRGIERAKVRDLSPELSAHYARLSDRTLLRDIAAVIRMKLVRDETDRLIANRELMFAFVPRRAGAQEVGSDPDDRED